jgi:hypothetical protein
MGSVTLYWSANTELISSARHIIAGVSEKVQVQSLGPFEVIAAREEGISRHDIEDLCEVHVEPGMNS